MNTTTPQTDLTLSEVIDSMNGFDEIAVEKKFDDFNLYDVIGADGDIRPRDMVKALRVGIFLVRRSEGLNDHQAYEAVMEMPSSQVNGFFAEEPDEIDPEDPDTEAGKDSSAPA